MRRLKMGVIGRRSIQGWNSDRSDDNKSEGGGGVEGDTVDTEAWARL